MQNLGYWQLKAAPGVFRVAIAGGGRAAELFNIVVPSSTTVSTTAYRNSSSSSSDEDDDAGVDEVASSGEGGGGGYAFHRAGAGGGGDGGKSMRPVGGLRIVVRDFTGPITQLTVAKKAGKEGEPLLLPAATPAPSSGGGGAGDSGGGSGSLLSRLSSSLFGGGSASGGKNATQLAAISASTSASASAAGHNDTRPLLHVFSLASGHLYERFLKIMMLSASRRTVSHRVKFWLLENTLSPAFKAAVPALEAAFGFDVAYVTYKWPNWLRQQTEKQRIIWGYKILFLDV